MNRIKMTQKSKSAKNKKYNPFVVILCKLIVYIVYGKFSEHFRWAYVAFSAVGIISIIGGIEHDTMPLIKGSIICILLAVTSLPVILSLVRKYEDD